MSNAPSAGEGYLRLRRLRTDWRAIVATVVVTLAMSLEHYDRFLSAFGSQQVER